MKKSVIVILSLIMSLVLFFSIRDEIRRLDKNYLKYNVTFDGLEDIEQYFLSSSDYYQYKKLHHETYPVIDPIVFKATAFTHATGDFEMLPSYENRSNVLLTGEEGEVTWHIDIEQSGFYNIGIHYYPYPGKSSMIERSLRINGNSPFEGAKHIALHRIWGNKTDLIQDIFGNDIRPSQAEKPFWLNTLLKDSVGQVSEPYAFYLEEGQNSITLISNREPLLIDTLEIKSVIELPTYDDIKATYLINQYEIKSLDKIIIQAEEPKYTTSPTIYPLNDRTSPKTMPSDPRLIKLNTIGGNNWRVAGDRIAWTIEVEESGLYAISMRMKQKLAAGMSVGRKIYIDGEIPFKELENYSFIHSNDWRIQTLGTKEEAFLFYFEQGKKHELSMEVSLGLYGPLIAQIQHSINQLNQLYREILVYTGPQPDQFRDYQLTVRIPNLISRLESERDLLSEVRSRIIEISGSKSEKTGILDTVLLQLDDFIKKPREIHKNLTTYNGNISSLGTLIILLNSQPLEIDYFVIHEPGLILPPARAGMFGNFWYSFLAFIATFSTDYSQVGKTTQGDGNQSIEVWLSVGKDQANVLRRLIDESFTPQYGIQVDLKLVNAAVLLPATLAKVGPDVAMGQGNTIPINYAMRNAAYDLTNFDDFDEVITQFKESAMVPYHYEGGYYALPEQQIFLMMFYRRDIFEDLGLTPPNTWDDVISLIPDLQKYNLEFFLPVPVTVGTIADLPPNPIYASMFFQNDGEFYINGGKESGFNEGLGPMVFERWTQFYTDYSFPVEANFVNRFRSGQMPIGISYYNTYNILSVFAPEIRGRWDFLPIPGTIAYDESNQPYIRRETVSTGTGVMIMDQAKNKPDAWEFLKWWVSTDTQVQFGREMEGILGAAARYPTANVEAMSRLPWTVSEYQRLEAQWNWVKGIPEVPGGYMTGRHLDNAFRLVLEDSSNPRETIYDFVQIINEEIAKKRREFGLE
jgi:ABC-type glycerol-3-phosphate transport system substrate-binding protein